MAPGPVADIPRSYPGLASASDRIIGGSRDDPGAASHGRKELTGTWPVHSTRVGTCVSIYLWSLTRHLLAHLREPQLAERSIRASSELARVGVDQPASSVARPCVTLKLAVMNMMGPGAAGMGGQMYPPPPPPMMVAPPLHGHGPAAVQHHPPNNWVGNDANTLLVVATLITTLTYQLGSNIPGGFWQDTQLAPDGKTVLHLAGDPIMRDLHRPRYWLFMAASWMGFAGSMLMTLSLLVRMPVDSRHVRWSFAVAYSSLVLTFIVSQSRTHLSLDILIWVVVVAFLWVIISVRAEHRARILRFFCCAGDN